MKMEVHQRPTSILLKMDLVQKMHTTTGNYNLKLLLLLPLLVLSVLLLVILLLELLYCCLLEPLLLLLLMLLKMNSHQRPPSWRL